MATHKSLSGYNLYFKEQMPTIKTQYADQKSRLSAIGRGWQSLSQDVKDQWNIRASHIKPKPKTPTSSQPKARGLSGYNLFVREQTKGHPADILDAKIRMGTIGTMWHQLSASDRAQYKLRAKSCKKV
jgi:hypothetical protein